MFSHSSDFDVWHTKVHSRVSSTKDFLISGLRSGTIEVVGNHFTSLNIEKGNDFSVLDHELSEGLFNWSSFAQREQESEGDSKKPISVDGVKCEYCGESLRYTYTDDGVSNPRMVPNKDTCHTPSAINVDIDVPSGTLLVCNSLLARGQIIEPYYNINRYSDGKGISIDCLKGRETILRNCASLNMGFVFVSDSSPKVYQQGDSYTFMRPHYDDLNDMYILPEGYNHVGSVCTDLWWVTFVDVEVYKNLLIQAVGETEGIALYSEQMNDEDITLLKVSPGKYNLHVPYISDYDNTGLTFATLTKKTNF